MLKFVSTLALITTIAFTGFAQAPKGWNQQRERVQSEQIAKNTSRLHDATIANIRSEEVKTRESREQGLSAETSRLIDDLLKEASTHIGKRYVWGSKGPATFDCSGFSGYVYRQFGYQIGSCSREQYKLGKSVDKKDLRKGDLVFFTSRSSGKNVGHVGIVWDVDRENGTFKFIHASIRGVKISEFEGYYVNRYVGARRIIE